MASYLAHDLITDEDFANIPEPGDAVRFYTSKDRKSYMDGLVTDFIDNPEGGGSEPILRVRFGSRVVRGGKPQEVWLREWLPMSALEVTQKAEWDD